MKMKNVFLLLLSVAAVHAAPNYMPSYASGQISWDAITIDSLEKAQALLDNYSGEERQEIGQALKYYQDEWVRQFGSYQIYSLAYAQQLNINILSLALDVAFLAASSWTLTDYFCNKKTGVSTQSAVTSALILVISVLAFEKTLSNNSIMKQNVDMYERIQKLITYVDA